MRDFVILTDSCCDMTAEMAGELVERFLDGMHQLGISGEEALQMIRAEQEARGR